MAEVSCDAPGTAGTALGRPEVIGGEQAWLKQVCLFKACIARIAFGVRCVSDLSPSGRVLLACFSNWPNEHFIQASILKGV